jgi:DNA transposition AAA+ family ATPase
MTVKSRFHKMEEQVSLSTREAINSAHQAHKAVIQAQSSLLPQEIQYAERKVSEALEQVRHVQNHLGQISPELQANLSKEENRLMQEYELF